MLPHVPEPSANIIMTIVFAGILALLGTVVFAVLAPRLRLRRRYAPAFGIAVIVVATIALLQLRFVDTAFGGYFSFKTPLDRLHDDLADFDEFCMRDPDIRRVVEASPAPDLKLRMLRIEAWGWLDDASVLKRGHLLQMLLPRVHDATCSQLYHGRPENSFATQADFGRAMLDLPSEFLSRYLTLLYLGMRAEAQGGPRPISTQADLDSALRAAQQKMSPAEWQSFVQGLSDAGTDSTRSRSVRTLVDMAPSLPDRRAASLLRLLN